MKMSQCQIIKKTSIGLKNWTLQNKFSDHNGVTLETDHKRIPSKYPTPWTLNKKALCNLWIFKKTDQNLWYKTEGLSRKFIDRNDYVRKKKILNYQCFLFLFQESRKKDNQTKSKENIRNKINKKQKLKIQ